MANRYSVTLEYSDYSDSHSNFEIEGKIKIIAVTYNIALKKYQIMILSKTANTYKLMLASDI